MRILIIDDDARAEIKKVVDYAQAHKVFLSQIRLIVAKQSPPVGDDANYVCYVNNGYRITFSIEEQPCGWCRHISISVSPVDGKQLLPNVPSVELLLKEFGFVGDNVLDCSDNISIEDENVMTMDGARQAINILQLIR